MQIEYAPKEDCHSFVK